MSSTQELQQQWEAIKAGQVLFTKTATGWLVWGRTENLTIGAATKVSKRDGTTTTVEITRTGTVHERDGVQYTVAEFRPVATTRPVRRACTHDEADNRGICYSCGAYVRSADAGRLIW